MILKWWNAIQAREFLPVFPTVYHFPTVLAGQKPNPVCVLQTQLLWKNLTDKRTQKSFLLPHKNTHINGSVVSRCNREHFSGTQENSSNLLSQAQPSKSRQAQPSQARQDKPSQAWQTQPSKTSQAKPSQTSQAQPSQASHSNILTRYHCGRYQEVHWSNRANASL